MSEPLLLMAAFLSRFAALMPAFLVYRFFRQVTGPTVPAFRRVFAAWAVLLIWFTVSSVCELLAFIPLASSAAERGLAYVFIPNVVIAIPMWCLYWGLRKDQR